MALTANQRRLLREVIYKRWNEGTQSFELAILQLAESSEAQVVNYLKNYAAEQKVVLQAQRDRFAGDVIPDMDAEIVFYEGED